MNPRHAHTNIPIEIIRTIVAIAELGSFSKAAERLSLSQPAISAQVKRLNSLIGGPVFHTGTSGVTFTPTGTLVLAHARRIVEANDRILALGGSTSETRPLRFGLSNTFAELFLRAWRPTKTEEPVSIICDHSTELTKSFADGYLDVACLINPPAELETAIYEWQETYVWVRHRDFDLQPGCPIPIVAWPGIVSGQPIIAAMEKAGVAYRVVFASADQHARLAAVRAGVGILGLPARLVTEPIVIAKEYHLPPLNPLRIAILISPHANMESIAPIIEQLKQLAPPETQLRSL
jgi:DNA-binding transcriptional LysR family regulator